MNIQEDTKKDGLKPSAKNETKNLIYNCVNPSAACLMIMSRFVSSKRKVINFLFYTNKIMIIFFKKKILDKR